MDKAVEEEVSNCIPCQANTDRCTKEPLCMSELPRGPWLNLSVEFLWSTTNRWILTCHCWWVLSVSSGRNSPKYFCWLWFQLLTEFSLCLVSQRLSKPTVVRASKVASEKSTWKRQESNTTRSHQDGPKPTLKLSHSTSLSWKQFTLHICKSEIGDRN